jgi:hypothetical protein
MLKFGEREVQVQRNDGSKAEEKRKKSKEKEQERRVRVIIQVSQAREKGPNTILEISDRGEVQAFPGEVSDFQSRKAR